MKRYMVVEKDSQLPLKDCKNLKECAEYLGISVIHCRKLHCGAVNYGKKANYRILSYELPEEEVRERRRLYEKKYALQHDRTEYFRDYYLKKKMKKVAI